MVAKYKQSWKQEIQAQANKRHNEEAAHKEDK